ncbi:MAG: hypothetical protein ACXVJW_18825 [Acidimicrobiia bacterium]
MRSDEPSLLEPGDLGDQLRELRDELCVAPDEHVRAAHLAAIDAAVMDAAAHRMPRPEYPSRRTRVFALTAAATIGVLGITGGMAAAGTLPGPAQREVARVADAVGWEIPGHPGASVHVPASDAKPGRKSPSASTTTSVHGEGRSGKQTPAATNGASDTTAPTGPVTSPGNSGTAPGQTGTTPGQTGTTPGQSGSGSGAPGNSGNAPGQTNSSPGKSGAAPGLTGMAHGNAANAPGNSGIAPGSSGSAPGHNKGVQGADTSVTG